MGSYRIGESPFFLWASLPGHITEIGVSEGRLQQVWIHCWWTFFFIKVIRLVRQRRIEFERVEVFCVGGLEKPKHVLCLSISLRKQLLNYACD